MAEERFDLFHYAKRLPTKRDENMEHYNRMLSSLHRKRGNYMHHTDLYPWLAPDDPCRFQTDSQILYEKIDLSQLHMVSKEKAKLMKLIIKYRDAFSLRDEIGAYPNLTADIQVIDESPFFVKPDKYGSTLMIGRVLYQW